MGTYIRIILEACTIFRINELSWQHLPEVIFYHLILRHNMTDGVVFWRYNLTKQALTERIVRLDPGERGNHSAACS